MPSPAADLIKSDVKLEVKSEALVHINEKENRPIEKHSRKKEMSRFGLRIDKWLPQQKHVFDKQEEYRKMKIDEKAKTNAKHWTQLTSEQRFERNQRREEAYENWPPLQKNENTNPPYSRHMINKPKVKKATIVNNIQVVTEKSDKRTRIALGTLDDENPRTSALLIKKENLEKNVYGDDTSNLNAAKTKKLTSVETIVNEEQPIKKSILKKNNELSQVPFNTGKKNLNASEKIDSTAQQIKKTKKKKRVEIEESNEHEKEAAAMIKEKEEQKQIAKKKEDDRARLRNVFMQCGYVARDTAGQDKKNAAREDLTAGRDDWTAPRDDMTAGRDDLTAPRDYLTAPRDYLTAPRDDMTAGDLAHKLAHEQTAALLDDDNCDSESSGGNSDDLFVDPDTNNSSKVLKRNPYQRREAYETLPNDEFSKKIDAAFGEEKPIVEHSFDKKTRREIVIKFISARNNPSIVVQYIDGQRPGWHQRGLEQINMSDGPVFQYRLNNSYMR